MSDDAGTCTKVSLVDISAARDRIQEYVHSTPVMQSSYLDSISGLQLLFKCENFQKTGSFKVLPPYLAWAIMAYKPRPVSHPDTRRYECREEAVRVLQQRGGRQACRCHAQQRQPRTGAGAGRSLVRGNGPHRDAKELLGRQSAGGKRLRRIGDDVREHGTGERDRPQAVVISWGGRGEVK